MYVCIVYSCDVLNLQVAIQSNIVTVITTRKLHEEVTLHMHLLPASHE